MKRDLCFMIVYLFLFPVALFSQSAAGGSNGASSQSSSAVPRNLSESRVIIRDTPENLARITELLKKFDRPPLQVITQVYIVQLDKSYEKQLGVDWKGALTRVGSSRPESEFSVTPGSEGAPDAKDIFRYGDINTEHFEFLLKSLESESRGKVISKPIIMTVSGKQSTIRLATQEPYRTSQTNQQTGVTTTTVNFLDVGITLDLTPTVYSDGMIHFVITPNVSVKTGVFDNVPVIARTTATTEVIIKHNSSVVIGGLLNRSLTNSQKKLPYFSRIPLLGKLFSGKSDVNKEQEVVIIIHARIVDPESNRTDGATLQRFTAR